MGKLKSAAVTFAVNFLVGFGLATVVRNRKTGVRAGLALGLLAAVGVLVSGGADEAVEEFETELDAESATEA